MWNLFKPKTPEQKFAAACRNAAKYLRYLWGSPRELALYPNIVPAELRRADKFDALAARLEQGLITYEYALTVLP